NSRRATAHVFIADLDNDGRTSIAAFGSSRNAEFPQCVEQWANRSLAHALIAVDTKIAAPEGKKTDQESHRGARAARSQFRAAARDYSGAAGDSYPCGGLID